MHARACKWGCDLFLNRQVSGSCLRMIEAYSDIGGMQLSAEKKCDVFFFLIARYVNLQPHLHIV